MDPHVAVHVELLALLLIFVFCIILLFGYGIYHCYNVLKESIDLLAREYKKLQNQEETNGGNNSRGENKSAG